MTRRRRCELLLIVALVSVPAVAPAVALGQTSLTELGAANAARNDAMSNSAGTATAAAPPASRPARTRAPAPTATNGMKYTLSYALTGLLLGLGLYLVCRPSNRHAVE